MKYHVYENRRTEGCTARVHRADCVHFSRSDLDAGESRWLGPFDSAADAIQAAEGQGLQASLCRVCCRDEAAATEASFIEWASRRQAAHEALVDAMARMEAHDQLTLLRRLRTAHTLPSWRAHYENTAEEIAAILMLLSYPAG